MEQIEQDLKSALISADKLKVNTLRSLKSAVLYEKIANNKRDNGLTDEEVIIILSRESKKRQESIDLYLKGNDQERADKELAEKKIIDSYLPEQLSLEDLEGVVNEAISELNPSSMADMGKVIAKVKQLTAGAADGATIAKMVKEKMS